MDVVDLPNSLASKIELVPESGCWIWVASCHPDGYGKVYYDKKTCYAHRVVYALLRHPIQENLQIDHLCRVRCCVNPNHLEPVTAEVNRLRGYSMSVLNSRKTSCSQGHPLFGENLIVLPKERKCRACTRKYKQTYSLKKKAELCMKYMAHLQA